MFEKINDNAYKLPGEYGVSDTFNVSDLSPFFNSTESRTTPFQEGEDDEDITHMATTLPTDSNTSSVMQENTYQGPITRSHVKQIQNQVNANLSLLSYYIDMAVLPISSTLIVRKCTGNEDIIPELVQQKDSERGAFGATPHVGLTLMCRAKEELAPIVAGPTHNKGGCGFLLHQTSQKYSFSTPILFMERDKVNSN